MSKVNIWGGVCDAKHSYKSSVILEDGKIYISQAPSNPANDYDVIVMEVNEAIDIAFAILRDLAPTLHETLEKLNAES